MIAENKVWASYYAELDPAERLDIFNSLADTESTLDDFRRTLYQQRYHDPKHPDRKVDAWLWKCVYLPGLYKSRLAVGNPMQREMWETLREFHLEASEQLSEAEREILYLEFRNTARRYISTCQGDRYGSKIFGLKKATAEEKKKQICKDIWEMSRGIAHAAGMEEELQLWSAALYDELIDYDPSYQSQYEAMDKKIRR